MYFIPTSASAQSSAAAISPSRLQALPLRATLFGLLAVMGSVGSAQAQEGPSVKVKQPAAASLFITVENPAMERVQMQVTSLSNNTCLAKEVNRQASYGSQLSFKGVPAGQYAVLLSIGREKYRYNVQVKAQPQTTISVPGLTQPEQQIAVLAR